MQAFNDSNSAIACFSIIKKNSWEIFILASILTHKYICMQYAREYLYVRHKWVYVTGGVSSPELNHIGHGVSTLKVRNLTDFWLKASCFKRWNNDKQTTLGFLFEKTSFNFTYLIINDKIYSFRDEIHQGFIIKKCYHFNFRCIWCEGGLISESFSSW